MFNIFKTLSNRQFKREAERLRPLVEQVNGLEPEMRSLSDEELDALISQLRRVADANADRSTVLVCRSDLRLRLYKCLRPHIPQIPVLSRGEIAADIALEIVAEVGQSLLVREPALAA